MVPEDRSHQQSERKTAMGINELPLGFGMALAQHPDAMDVFSKMDDKEKQSVIDKTHYIQSKTEMHNFVIELSRRNTML